MAATSTLLITPMQATLASVRRTLAWADTDPQRLASSRWLGAVCARLIAPLAAEGGADVAEQPALQALLDQLLALDALEGAARQDAVKAALDAVGAWVPPELAPVIVPTAPKAGSFVDPRRRRQRDRGRGRSGSQGGGDEAGSDAAEGDEPETDEASATAPDRAPSARTRADNDNRGPALDAAAEDADNCDDSDTGEGGRPPDSAPADGAPADSSPADGAVPAAPSGKDRSERRRSRDRRRGRDRQERSAEASTVEAPAAAPAPPPEPAPPPRRLLGFGHPEGTGRRLADLPGIDPALVEGLASQDIDTIADLLLTAPSALERPPRVNLSPPSEGAVLVRGALGWRRILLSPGHRRVELLLSLKDGQTLRCRWLGDEPRGWSDWTAGMVLALVGELGEDDDGPVLYNAEPVGIDGRGSGLLASYGLEGVDDRALRSLIARCLSEELGHLEDWLPAGILEDQRLLPLDEALRDAHFPANGDGRGRVRLAYEELLTIQLGIAWRAGRGTGERGFAHKILHRGVGQLDSQHSITLNDGQEQAFNEIRRDLLRPRPMARLLQGDVGAGKGLVALMSAVMVAEAGGQVVIVAPDALAAERRFLHAEGLLRSLGVMPLLVAGAPDHAAADALRRGEAHVVFGTGALLDPRIEWKRLGLAIAEERGPYGTVQRASLEGRSPRPDLLVVTRSPIPTSLVFTVFGDFDVSVVLAEGRLRTLCAVHPATERSAAYAHARNAVKAGRQAFVVFPVRDGRDLLGREDALRMAKALQADVLQGARVGVYSSEMPREERTRAFDDFHHRRIDVLVCTTFIEDAPAVANASVMVVEYADLHNLVRLHRLRGHVDAGNLPGHCDFVLSDDPSAEGLRVVEQVVSERDGFRLAEVDLEIRGNVALLGDRADEVPDLRWAEPARDRQLLLRARAEAFRLLGEDPGLRRSKTLQRAVLQRWGDWLDRHIAPDESRRASPPADGRKAADPAAAATAAAATADGAGRRRRRRRRR